MNYTTYSQFQSLENNEIQFENLVSVKPVTGVGFSRGGLLTTSSTALLFTGFPIQGIVQSLELRLHVTRLARIQDKTIQLWHNNAKVGKNLANLNAEDINSYFWSDLDIEWTPESGIIIDLQPHIQYPSSNTVYIRSVELRKIG